MHVPRPASGLSERACTVCSKSALLFPPQTVFHAPPPDFISAVANLSLISRPGQESIPSFLASYAELLLLHLLLDNVERTPGAELPRPLINSVQGRFWMANVVER